MKVCMVFLSPAPTVLLNRVRQLQGKSRMRFLSGKSGREAQTPPPPLPLGFSPMHLPSQGKKNLVLARQVQEEIRSVAPQQAVPVPGEAGRRHEADRLPGPAGLGGDNEDLGR